MKIQWIYFGLVALLATGIEARPPDASGGGFVDHHAYADAMSQEVRTLIELELEASAERLRREGKLPEVSDSLDPMSLGWPLNARAGFEFDDYHGISNFVDLDSDYPNQLLDYMCGTRTYDLDSGYNHAGIDYYLWPFSWRMMDQEKIEIVAVAPGVILAKHDGHFDRNCSFGDGMWNAVYVQHADGTVAWYGHMKEGSTTDKQVGASVIEGEYLGLVGSSGSSTGPHLHLELRSSSLAGATIYEPHAGACRTGDSLWQNQRAYFDTALNGVGVHNAQPSLAVDCPNPGQEAAALVNHVPLGDPIWFSIFLRDALDTQPVITLTLYRPDGEIYHQWTFDFDPGAPTHYSGAWWWWTWSSGLGTHPAFEGIWTFEATMGDQTVSREFGYGEVPAIFVDRFEE
jgi:murein DD-endopeptidase MepM/ murein hydrolase activator NlpD